MQRRRIGGWLEFCTLLCRLPLLGLDRGAFLIRRRLGNRLVVCNFFSSVRIEEILLRVEKKEKKIKELVTKREEKREKRIENRE